MKKIGALILVAAYMIMAALLWQAFAAAPTQLFVDGSTSWERSRIERLEHQLNFTNESMPNSWDIHIIPEIQFEANIRRYNINTESAYTFLPLDRTYLNEFYLQYADDRRVRHTLAHEAGHMICNCTSEEKAEEIAYQLEK
jgi:hypothetical protein